jgi:uncharacterized protein with PQ loop repeat
MGIISNIKNRYKINKDTLWYLNFGFCIVSVIDILYIIFEFRYLRSEFPENLGLLALILCVALNVITFICNRKFFNTPVTVVNSIGLFLSSYIMYRLLRGEPIVYRLIGIIPFVACIISIVFIVSQWHIRNSVNAGEALVKVAKVKLSFDFTPEDVINDYRLSLAEIENRYNMGNDDRASFEHEKQELLADVHQILMELVTSDDVCIMDKLETIHQAKTECIILEDNYLLWKNQLLKDEDVLKQQRDKAQELYEAKAITEEEYNHRMELLKDEF